MEAILSQAQEALLKRTRETLGRLRDVLAESSAAPGERAALADSIRQLDELFLLVVAGEFNSGKSAFINALLGQTLQPEGVTPTTDRIYLLKFGPTVERKPGENGVWIHTAPVELLKKISVVDTPGTNAIVREHEALTAEFIPRSDLVLFVTSADRPFTESEREFLAEIKAWGKKIVLVVNKIDNLDSAAEVDQVIEFVTRSAQRLIGDIAAVFPISARKAQQAKDGRPELWPDSRFAELEQYIQDTLDDEGRFRLKLLNPLGVGSRLVSQQLHEAEADLASLEEDRKLLEDIHRQMTYYNDDMQRNFRARMGEINSLLYAMEKRGNAFFDDRMRLARIPDLLRSKQLERDFETEVITDTPRLIESHVGEMVDWLVEQDLRQWTAVANHLDSRKDAHQGRIVGDAAPREGTLAYDRQRLIDSIGRATHLAVESYDQDRESAEMAESARQAVVNTGLAGVGASLGVIIAAASHLLFLDVTGIVAGITAATLGLLIIPARKRKAKQELANKLGDLRQKLVTGLDEQFEREMRHSARRIEETVAPFDRFVRSETDRISDQRQQLRDLQAHINDLQHSLRP